MTDNYKIEELIQEISNLKESTRFFLKLNIGSIVTFFGLISYLSTTTGEAITNTIRLKSLLIILSLSCLLGLYCEYIATSGTEKCDYILTLQKRYEKLTIAYKFYLISLMLPTGVFFYVIFTIGT